MRNKRTRKNPAQRRKATKKARPAGVDAQRKAAIKEIDARLKGKAPSPRGQLKPRGEKSPKRTSGLSAAALVLSKASEPMTADAIIKAAADQGLWKSPGGKTPAATISSAIRREIGKGGASRFKLAGRGLFAATAKAAQPA